ncbi:uncharacterized protein LOC112576076 isoform X3 [Pomacea canaliculata]|nr:uncharacterized protein LOC112576076 isoform X3 [Pomacea canaliculata]XP_025114100.1 uncharacterized protein LOC112576076 isoform X3 [Pomacea canaliculata]
MIMTSGVSKETRSLLITENCNEGLRQSIEQVVSDHELLVSSPSEALVVCSERVFQLVWVQLPNPPSEDYLSVITAIRYSSKYNRKTIILGVTSGQPEIDLHLHGVDEILLEPVSVATIRQKYFDWTSVKLIPYHDIGLKETAIAPATPESSVSTESTSIEISLSSLASVVTNDSGIQGDTDMVDLKPPPAFLFPSQQSQPQPQPTKDSKFGVNVPAQVSGPSTPPSWCRMEHATKEKHRSSSQVHRERIKDSCDQLRVLLPYVRGRKTDMASILEMTVDYLKIVNSKLPHEFHSHVLDMMTKGNAAATCGSRRASGSGGRGAGGRGGRGRGSKRGTTSPSKSLSASSITILNSSTEQQADNFLCTTPGRMLTRSLSRTGYSPSGSGGKGSSGTRGCRTNKRNQSATSGLTLSPAGGRVSVFYSGDSKERGFLQPSHHMATLLVSDGSPPSPITSTPTSSHGLNPVSMHMTCTASPASSSSMAEIGSMTSGPRLFASAAHLALERLVSQSGYGAPPGSMTSALPTRFSLGGERDTASSSSGLSMGTAGMAIPCTTSGMVGYGESPAAPTGYYHYYSGMADLSSAYAVAGGGGGGNGGGIGVCGGGSAGSGSVVTSLCNDFLTSTPLMRLPTSCSSAFASRLPPAPSRGKVEEPDQHFQSLTEAEDVYGSLNSATKGGN